MEWFYSLFNQRMSSLAASRADGYYRPKNFDPDKMEVRKSDFQHEKPFKVVEGERVGGSKVRYETPFHVRCEGCQNMVGKGVRFNSIKTWVDNFHSTKIYQFRMKCPQCPQRFVVRTDPQNCEYLYVSGAKRIFQTKDCTEQQRIRDESVQKRIRQNPFAKLENQFNDIQAYGGMEDHLLKLQEMQERGQEDFQLNRMLRKHAKEMRQQQRAYFHQKAQKNMFIPLLPPIVEDMVKAEGIQFKQEKKRRIKKQERGPLSERDRLKEKMKRMNPQVRNQLQQQIKIMNKPSTVLKK